MRIFLIKPRVQNLKEQSKTSPKSSRSFKNAQKLPNETTGEDLKEKKTPPPEKKMAV